jgi:hypothetical protein
MREEEDKDGKFRAVGFVHDLNESSYPPQLRRHQAKPLPLHLVCWYQKKKRKKRTRKEKKKPLPAIPNSHPHLPNLPP